MDTRMRTLIKNVVVAATLGLAAIASWALTEYRAHEVSVQLSPQR